MLHLTSRVAEKSLGSPNHPEKVVLGQLFEEQERMKKTCKTDGSEVFGLPTYYQALCKAGTGLGTPSGAGISPLTFSGPQHSPHPLPQGSWMASRGSCGLQPGRMQKPILPRPLL